MKLKHRKNKMKKITSGRLRLNLRQRDPNTCDFHLIDLFFSSKSRP